MSIYDVFNGGSKPFDKAEWAAQKQAQRKEAYELIDNTCAEMMISGDSFRQYLDVQGRFDRYSVANAILVSAQMPEATQLKDYNTWKQSRVYVNKDAQKVVILEPSKEYTRDDGTKGISYNAKVVYDISETSAKERMQPQEQKSMRELVSALIDASPCLAFPLMTWNCLPTMTALSRLSLSKRDSLRKCCLSVWQRKYLRRFMTLSTMRAVTLPISNPFALPIW